MDNPNVSELRPCPFCGGQLEFFGHDIDREIPDELPEEKVVALYQHQYSDDEKQCALGGLVFKFRHWQKRPLEDAQAARIADLEDDLSMGQAFVDNLVAGHSRSVIAWRELVADLKRQIAGMQDVEVKTEPMPDDLRKALEEE